MSSALLLRGPLNCLFDYRLNYPSDEHDKPVDIDVVSLEVRVKGPADYNQKAAVHRGDSGTFIARSDYILKKRSILV